MFSTRQENLDAVFFYRGECSDHAGRSLTDILGRDFEWLESTHDFIQWLFPLTAPSSANSCAPILSQAAILAFQEDKLLQEKLKSAFEVMLGFYGLTLNADDNGKPCVKRLATFEKRQRVWLRNHNHNFLRITRILKSLSLLGLQEHARAFFDALSEIYRDNKTIIGSETFSYWRHAVH